MRYAEFYDVLKSIIKGKLNRMIADAEKGNKNPEEEITKQYPEYCNQVIDRNGKLELPDLIDKIIDLMLTDLNKLKEFIIKEVSTIHEINSQIKIEFEGSSLGDVIYRIIKPYEPVEAIRTAAIPTEMQKLRKSKMIHVFVEMGIPEDITREQALNVAGELYYDLGDVAQKSTEDIVKELRIKYREILEAIIYGGGANKENISVVGSVWGGAFIGRASLVPENACEIVKAASDAATYLKKKLTIIFNFKAGRTGPYGEYYKLLKQIDFTENVNVILGVNLLDAEACFKELQEKGENVSRLFADASKDSLPINITIKAGENIATQGIGSFTAHIPAEFLRQAGVTQAVVDSIEDYAAIQVKNLLNVGITPIILGPCDNKTRDNLREIFGDDFDKIEISGHAVCVTPIHKVRAKYANLREKANKSDAGNRNIYNYFFDRRH